MLNEDKCWRAVLEKDKTQDGTFFLGVLTTGIYCRPSCPARKPLRKNVRFYEAAADAERDGLRACVRCRPASRTDEDPDRARIEAMCQYIRENANAPIKLDELGRRSGLSRFHLQRTFKKITGVTPKQYAESVRVAALKGHLRSSRSVTDAVYDAGFGSSSRVYERADTRLGMTPAEYRAGGRNVSISYASAGTAVGRIMIGATDRGLCFVQFGESGEELLDKLRGEYPAAHFEAMKKPYSEQWRLWIDALARHLDGGTPRIDLPLDIRATAFQMKVWQYLQTIPYGEVQSYSEVAAGIGHPGSARAVAQACAMNRVAIAIPCHRVIRGNGELGGYRWGLERKRALLDRERAGRREIV